MQPGAWKPVNFAAINAVYLPRLQSLLPVWLPGGQRRGCEWYALNPTRTDRHIGSFCVNMQSGCWGDFATGDAGGDPVSLYAYINGLSQSGAARALLRSFGDQA
jgi:hypothetical protein